MPASISNATAIGPTIELINARVAFDEVAAVESLDLRCGAGEFVSIVGPSGCGKSTVLRVIAGLQSLTSGQKLLGERSESPSAGSALREQQTGFVFQSPTLLPWRNVIDNIALPLELSGVERPERLAAAREARELVGLVSDDEQKSPRKLSGGMRMRVSLARTLVTQPKVMLLDEPLAAVDDILRNELLVELASLWQQQHWTCLLYTSPSPRDATLSRMPSSA